MQRAVDQIIAQRSLKIRVNQSILDRGRIARLHTQINQEMKIRLTKMKINKRIKALALRAKLNWLKRKRGEIVVQMGSAEMKDESMKRKVIYVEETREKTQYQKWAEQVEKKTKNRSAFSVYQLVFRQRSLKAKVMQEIIRIGEYKKYKRAMLMELRMIKLKQLVSREIKRYGEQRVRKALLVEAIQVRGNKARVCHAIRMRTHWLLNSRLRFIRQKQQYLKARDSHGQRRKYELIRERAEQRHRRQQVDRILLQSRLKEKTTRAIEMLGRQKNLEETFGH